MLNGASTYTIDNTTIRNCRIVSYGYIMDKQMVYMLRDVKGRYVYDNYIQST